MTSTINTFEVLAQDAGLFDAAFDLAGRIEYDLRGHVFDNDPAARAQAEALLADARRFYNELLKAWPDNNAQQPSAEVERQLRIPHRKCHRPPAEKAGGLCGRKPGQAHGDQPQPGSGSIVIPVIGLRYLSHDTNECASQFVATVDCD